MARPRTTKATAGASTDLWPTLNPEQFQGQFDLWLRQHEAAKPFGKLRELEARVTEGERKIGAALKAGKVTPEDDAYKAALAKLEGLRGEKAELIRTASVPHFVMASVHDFLRASRGWGLPQGSYVEFRLPGVFDMKVDLGESEPPF